ncbi:MAG: glycosyl hydrolase [Akkermansiaceae bacterium]
MLTCPSPLSIRQLWLLIVLWLTPVLQGQTVLDFGSDTEGFSSADAGGSVVHSSGIGAGSLQLANPSGWHWRGKRYFTKSGGEAARYHAFANELANAGTSGGTLRFDLILRKNSAITGKTGSFWGMRYNIAINQAPPSGSGWVQKTILELSASAFPPAQNVTTHAISLPLRPWAESTSELRINPASTWFEINLGSNFGGATEAEWHIDNLRVVSDSVTTNQPPVFPNPSLTRAAAVVGSPYAAATLTGSASDPDPGDTLVFSKINGPAWLVIQPNGSLGGTPGTSDLGSNAFVVRVKDAAGLSADASLVIQVITEPPPSTIQLEAETAALTGVVISSSGTGYSGIGYVTGFDAASDKVAWSFNAASGSYRLSIRYRSQFGNKGFNGNLNGTGFSGTFPGSTTFTNYDAGLVELAAGSNTLEIGGGWNYYEIDAVSLTPETPVLPLPVPAIPCNPLATQAARHLLTKLTANYGTLTHSGQNEIAETSHIATVSGKLPAIIEGDFMRYSPSRIAFGENAGNYTESILAKHTAGHLVKFAWHWNAPTDLINTPGKEWWRGFYTYATTFDVAAALADPAGEDYALILRDIDAIAVQLKKAADANIPILWRPLHESEGGWFWWGAKGPGPFKELWRLLYQRLTVHHGLHNLIWVLTSEHPDWYPGHDVVDVVGVDAYPDNRSDALASRWAPLLARFDGIKPLALTEFGGVPDIERMHRLGVTWAWFCSWTGPYGSTSEPDEKVARIYQASEVVTLDELAPPNRSPVFAANPLLKPAAEAQAVFSGHSLAAVASDPDEADPLSFTKTSGPSWLVVAGNGSLSGTPAIADAGSNDFAVRVTDSGGLSAESMLRIEVTLSAFQSWQSVTFGASADDPAAAGPMMDPDGDGMNNLLEYAMGTEAGTPGGSPVQVLVVPHGATQQLRLLVPRNPLASDVIVTAEASSDLANPAAWRIADTIVISSTPQQIVFGDTGDGPRRFIRARIERASP